MDPIKLAAAGTGAVIVGGTGVGLHFFVNSLEPVWYSLSLEDGFSSDYSNNVGKDYGNYLVGVYGDKGDQKDRNQKWWEWSYKQLQYDVEVLKEKLSAEFFDNNTSKVSSPYKSKNGNSSTSSKALNEVCESIYKKNKGEADPDGTADSTKSRLSRDMWKYCSHLRTRPILLKENDYGAGEVGNETDHKDKAVSVKASGKDSSNDEFWRLRNDEFFGGKGVGKGNSASQGGLFKALYAKKETNTIGSKDTVKEACKTAYSTKTANKSTSPKVEDADIKKFCYLTPDPNN
ncbi:hypothetical protein MHSWG343_04650 [Candidatus Mycoplasma haematohominis]|uniref:Uncharacterized protein n=1 Tax=Candidatus Mycoplasma haematohominis TaxID=1494318 RepID=A0A478FPR0_9MOLU|nr:hypothetical protein MHSWG343_04650 [Candidatus Mycoplasma haemohominis]